jgi:hypothetical protein
VEKAAPRRRRKLKPPVGGPGAEPQRNIYGFLSTNGFVMPLAAEMVSRFVQAHVLIHVAFFS